MKKLMILCLCFVALSCHKQDRPAVLTADCTGYYLTIDGEDYRVCNYNVLDTTMIGSDVTVSYSLEKDCKSDLGIWCTMAHPYKKHVVIAHIEYN